MNTSKSLKRNLYYTSDHEWIDFQGSIAYVGICRFKLSGFKEIHQIEFMEFPDLIKPGKVIGNIKFDDYEIQVHMPVEGKIISINELLLTEEKNVLLQQPEYNGWIALVVPSRLNDTINLLSPEDYKLIQAKYQ